LFKIKLYVIGELENIEFSVLAESEFADANGNIFNDVKLIIPEIIDGFSTGEFFIAENHPNPFTDYTYIDYYLPDDGFVILEVKDMLGRNIQTLTNSNQSAGKYQVKFDGVGLANGAYIYNITYIKGPDRITKSQIMNILR